jgi:hypothetical protein
MKKIFFLLILALVSLPIIAQEKATPAASATTVVVVTGVGVDADKALRNAFRNAVEQAVGLVVDAETVVKNEDVIKDQILTYSDGYVDKFDRIKEGKRDDGLYEIKIQATVKRRQLIEKLKEEKISVAKVEGESLFAEVVTQLDAEKNAANLLEKALEGLPANLMVVKVVNQKPEIVKKDDAGAEVSWDIEVGFDFKEYKDKVLPKLEHVLGDTSLRKGNGEILNQVSQYDRGVNSSSGSQLMHQSTLSQKNEFWPDVDEFIEGGIIGHKTPERNSATELCVFLNTGKNEKGDTRRWRWFISDKATIAPVLKAVMARNPILTVDLLGADAQVIREDKIRFEDESVSIPIVFKINDGRWPETGLSSARAILPWFCRECMPGSLDTDIEIGPYLIINSDDPSVPGFGEFRYGQALDYIYKVQLTLDEMKSIREIRCSVANGQSQRR